MSTPKDIQDKIASLHKDIVDTIGHYGASGLTAPMVIQKHAEILDLTAQLAEISSRRLERQTNQLIYLTWALVALTFGLFILTLVLLILGK